MILIGQGNRGGVGVLMFDVTSMLNDVISIDNDVISIDNDVFSRSYQ